jgi:signal transduction histidine kinase
MNETVSTPMSQLYMRAAIVLAVVVSLGFTWLVIVAGALKPNVVNMLIQALVVAIVASLLYVVIRRFRRTRQELQAVRDNAEKEAALLRKRSAFIYEASSKLSDKLATFEAGIAGLDPNDKNAGPLIKKTTELRDLLERLETISKLEANMALTSTATVNAAAELDKVAAAYQSKFEAVGAKLQLTAPEEALVDGDAQMVRDVFEAVVDNAAKFMPSQGGMLDISAEIHRGSLTTTFTDNGPGIAADRLAELFQPFSRVDGVMAFNRQGHGLSLYISKLCVEIMGGTITLNSQEGSGTTVVITLPLTGHRRKRRR